MPAPETFSKPIADLLNLLCPERIAQHYHYWIETEPGYTTIVFLNRENRLNQSHQARENHTSNCISTS